MKALRTPDDRFENLPDFPYAPHYAEIDDGEGGHLRVHYLDEGPRNGDVVLLMHGEPSWCFLYRKMIPVLTAAGLRCIAPDLIGFGRSDKPTERTDYTYGRHVEWMRRALFDALDLHDVTLVCQDWGGLIGLRLVGEHPDRFARVVTANTFLPTGDTPPGEAFLNWQQFSQTVDDFAVGVIVGMGCHSKPGDAVVAAYNAPFPDDSYKAGARQFPMLVPTSPDDPAAAANRNAWNTLRAWTKPFLTAFSDHDAITRGGDRAFQRDVPGCAGQPHTTIEGGGHFLQEDEGPELARRGRELDRRPPIVSDGQPLDVFAFLDEVQAIARSGLHYTENPFDKERYTKLLDAARREYEARTPLDNAAIRDRFAAEIGYVTAKVGADAAVFDEHDRIMLVHRADDAKWGLSTGWVDPNESPEQTVVRELAEEAGIESVVDALVGVFFREARAGEHPHGTVSVVYLCSITGGQPTPQLHEVSEIAWRAIDDVAPHEWHHHHERLARAALDAHWRRRAGL